MKIDSIERLESKLALMHQRKYCIATSRATSAIYLALKSFLPKGGKVIFPATICTSPIYAALYALCDPVFCDVDYQDGNLSVKELSKILSKNSIDAIFISHMYGNVANINPLVNLAKKHNIFVIEDVAQAHGGSYKGKILGSFGDVSVLSFGHTKILDIGYGGALLTDDVGLANQVRFLESQLAVSNPDYLKDLSAEYKKTYYHVKELTDTSPRLFQLFHPFPAIFRDLYLQKRIPEKLLKVDLLLDNLSFIVDERRRKAKLYENLLIHPNIKIQHMRNGSVPWRFNFYFDNQHSLTLHLRKEGFDASNWYQNAYFWFNKYEDNINFEYSNSISQQIINLWLDDNTTDKTIKNCCDSVIKFLN